MFQVKLSRRAPVSAAHAFRIVTATENFPKYVAGVQRVTKENVSRIGEIERFDARAYIRTKLLAGTLTAKVEIDHAERTVAVAASAGPIKVVRAKIAFTEVGDGVEAAFQLAMDTAVPFLKSAIEDRLTRYSHDYADLFLARTLAVAA